jgi:hypothetical protein
MRFFTLTLFLMALPTVALSQQSPTPTSNTLSHWSTTGSAIQYAPDMDPAEEARLRHDFPTSMDSLIETIDLHSAHSGEGSLGFSIPQQQLYFSPYLLRQSLSDTSKLLPMQDPSSTLKLWKPIK